ncbi:MAG: hypothetical protein R2799_05610 [Crocinitomicaceae bacterium]
MKTLLIISTLLLSSFCLGQVKNTSEDSLRMYSKYSEDFYNSEIIGHLIYRYDKEGLLIKIDTLRHEPSTKILFGTDKFIYLKDSSFTDKVWIIGNTEYLEDKIVLSNFKGFILNKDSIHELSDFSNFLFSEFKIEELDKSSTNDSSINESYFQMLASFFPYSNGFSKRISNKKEVNYYRNCIKLLTYLDADELDCLLEQVSLINSDPNELLEQTIKYFENKKWEKAHIYGFYHMKLISAYYHFAIPEPYEIDYDKHERGAEIYEEAVYMDEFSPYESDCTPWVEKGIATERRVRDWCNSIGQTKYKLVLK